MTVMFTFRVSCKQCQTALCFEDERPDWKTYDYRVECSEDVERSARFVAEHADDPLPRAIYWEPYEDAGRPPFVSYEHRGDYTPDATIYPALRVPDPYRYIDCPVCDAKIREPNS